MVSFSVLGYRALQWWRTERRPLLWETAAALGLLACLLGYGAWRLNEGEQLAQSAKPLLRVALIQENTPSMFDANPERLVVAWDRYAEMTAKALAEAGHATGKPVDAVAWPESTFTGYSTRFHSGITWMEDKIVEQVPAEVSHLDRLTVADIVGDLQREFRSKVAVLHGTISDPNQPPRLPIWSWEMTQSILRMSR